MTHSKAWIEMIHRYMATAVGVLILTLALAHWRQWRVNREPRSALKPWWATATLVWVCIQGAFGALTVTMKLFPAIVTLHLLGGVVLLALLCAQAAQSMESQPPARVTGHVRGLLWLAGGAVVMQLLLGGWVSTNYAVLACNTFPTCQDSWWPVMDFDQGFELWRPLGHTARGELLGFAALTAIHFMHRLFAVVVVVTLVLLIRRLWQHVALARQGRYLAGLLLAQIGTGLSNVVLDWPLAAAVAHTGGAAAMVAVITWALASSRLTVAAAISISSSLVPEKSA